MDSPRGEDPRLPSTGAADEEIVAEYLRLGEGGERPDLQRFLSTIPADRWSECRGKIEAALKAEEVLGSLRAAARAEPAQPPRVPGFRILERIGEGGLGEVYAAWDETLERKVALKVLKRGTAGEVRQRILEEARKAAGLADPSIVTIHSVVEGGDRPAIVMEHVEGYPLDRASAALTFRQKARIVLEVARALAVAHGRGIIHRDLKPANVLLTPALKPKILDFGLAISPQVRDQSTGFFAGTPQYASPEQALGEKLTTASDIHSLGSVMFTVLAGRPPFEGKTLAEVLDRITGSDPPFPRSIAPGIPEDLQAICLACLARDPGSRPGAGDVAADLERYLAGEPVRLRPALYSDILRRRIEEHQRNLHEWQEQGMISGAEGDRLGMVYRRILADEDHWILDSRKVSLPQTALYTGTWMAVVAATLLVWLARGDLSPAARWLIPAASTSFLMAVGLWAHARGEVLAAASFLAGAVLNSVPSVLSALAEGGLFAARPEQVTQLLEPPFSNAQLLYASLVGWTLSVVAWWRLRLAGFAWTTALLTAFSYFALLLVRGWIDLEPGYRALWCLPLVALEGVALGCERVRRFRWALPFHLVAFVALVAALDVMAQEGPTLTMLGLDLKPGRARCFSWALNGLVFLCLMIFTERSRSLDLRMGSRVLEVLTPVHLIGALYANAREEKTGWDVALYLAAVVAVLLLGPWRGRKRFLLAGLAGIALGSHLLLDLKLIAKVPFVIGLGLTGLVAAVSTYLYLPRGGGRAPRSRGAVLLLVALPVAAPAKGEEARIEGPASVARFDAAELRVTVEAPSAKNPFTEVEVTAEFKLDGSPAPAIRVDGFSDSRDGGLHLVRFAPPAAGEYAYSVHYRSPAGARTFTGRLRAVEEDRPGPVVADPAHPRKLIRAGTGKPFFHLGYTAYHLLDPSHGDAEIERTIGYCAEHGFNKVRFLLTGYPRDPPGAEAQPRRDGDGEFGVVDLTTLPNYGARPGSVNALPAWEGKPHAYDFLRLNPDHWRRVDRAARLLREKGMIAGLIITLEKQDLPREYGALTGAEYLLYRYAVARLAAFDNVWWDLGNEHNEYRDPRWGEAMGRFVREHDPYPRMASAHAYADFLYPRSGWATYIIVQQYGDAGVVRDWALRHRSIDKPFVNEEYGYEGRRPLKKLSGHGGDRNETRRRHWAIAFGGGYATYGDWVDGAWYYEGLPGPGLAARELKHLRAFCEAIPFNEMEPRDEALAGPAQAFALEAPGRMALYLPRGGTIVLRPGGERAERSEWFDPRTGARKLATASMGGDGSLSFQAPTDEDWALDIRGARARP